MQLNQPVLLTCDRVIVRFQRTTPRQFGVQGLQVDTDADSRRRKSKREDVEKITLTWTILLFADERRLYHPLRRGERIAALSMGDTVFRVAVFGRDESN